MVSPSLIAAVCDWVRGLIMTMKYLLHTIVFVAMIEPGMMDAPGLENRLVLALQEEGWQVQRLKGKEADLVIEKDRLRYVAEIKAAREARRPLLEGSLASAILRARVAAELHHAKPLAIVCAPSISNASLQE